MISRASALKKQIETQLSRRIPAALSPMVRPEAMRLSLADARLTELLHGGVPVGAITEIHGAASSGRTSVALSVAAAVTAEGNVAAWVDATDALDPEAAALSGVDLARLLWVRCAAAAGEKGSPGREARQAERPDTETRSREASPSLNLVAANYAPRPVGNGGCGSPHPRGEGKGMAEAIDTLLHDHPHAAALQPRRLRRMIGTPGAPNRDVTALAPLPFPNASPYREEQVATDRQPSRRPVMAAEPKLLARSTPHSEKLPATAPRNARKEGGRKEDWGALDQALRAVDLLLQAGGFSLLVLDLGDIPVEAAWRIPLATWFRFRSACERSRAILLVVSQHPCARASADLTLAVSCAGLQSGSTVAVGRTIRLHVEQQRRGGEATKIVPFRKPVRSDDGSAWMAVSPWSVRA